MVRIGPRDINGYSDQGAKNNPENYFEYVKDRFPDAVVEPIIGKGGLVDNAKKLVPRAVRVLPEILDIYTRQPEYRYENFLENRTARKTSENCVFIYAYNEDGKLIRPWTPKPKEDLPPPTVRVPTYEIETFSQGWNVRRNGNSKNGYPSSIPILTANDFDAIGEYEVGGLLNPPHACMVKAISAGEFSVSVHLRLNPSIIKNEEAKLQTGDVIGAFKVNVIEGTEFVNAMGLTASKESKIFYSDAKKRFYIALTAGETVEFRAVGILDTWEWDDQKREYFAGSPTIIPFNKLEWSLAPKNLASVEAVELVLPSGSGSTLQIKAGTASGQVGLLNAHGLGKTWGIDLLIK
ncbi:hypothetical protein [Variovorax sp. 770b2]|uniref:hypothetical protein n=1 Tax=Variovorax sp. 770b2 TaxID=1566271 RepID=UPI0008E0953D|nr:hypothetical protein [Variovorax sp. 770b2]SFP19305.1 hypothetical protein SAMN03159339_0844 [Variovorax sp. 770b2]